MEHGLAADQNLQNRPRPLRSLALVDYDPARRADGERGGEVLMRGKLDAAGELQHLAVVEPRRVDRLQRLGAVKGSERATEIEAVLPALQRLRRARVRR